MDSEIALYTLS